MKKTVAIAVTAILICVAAVTVSATDAQSWYCVRNKEHRQPLVGNDLCWVERYEGYYIDHAHGDASEEKVIYLTFDAGYENGNVAKILDVLKQKQVSGAFFILKALVEDNTELVMRMYGEGHLVCNHTSNHPDMTKKSFEEFEAELKGLERICLEKTGKQLSRYFRPPEGRFDKSTLEYAKRLGYKTVFWSFAYADWDNQKQPSPTVAKQKILDNVHNGAVILLHPTSATNAEILGEVIDELTAQGYSFGTLDQLTS